LILIKLCAIAPEVIPREAWHSAHDTPKAKDVMKFSPS
jgi:hypothetical protein